LGTEEDTMVAYADEKPVLLIKKLGGVVLLIVGLLLAALGFANGSTMIGSLGVLVLAAGAVLLALKIARRNEGGQA
jgi:hypothetical protein